MKNAVGRRTLKVINVVGCHTLKAINAVGCRTLKVINVVGCHTLKVINVVGCHTLKALNRAVLEVAGTRSCGGRHALAYMTGPARREKPWHALKQTDETIAH